MLSKIINLFKKPKTEETEIIETEKFEKNLPDSVDEIAKPEEKPSVKNDVEISTKEEKISVKLADIRELSNKHKFTEYDIPDTILKAIKDLKFDYCTPIQAQLLENTLKQKDAVGQAQTGTGKTAAYLITIFSRFLKEEKYKNPKPGSPFAVVLAPTRELVLQISKDAELLSKYTDLKVGTVFGGMDYRKQINMMKSDGIHLIIATPGRLIDFLDKRLINFRDVQILVLDEADRMLDMGFIPDVRRIIKSFPPKVKRQTLFFSATIDTNVKRLARYWTDNPVEVEIEPEKLAADSIDQKLYMCTSEEKITVIYNLLKREKDHLAIIFTNMRDDASKLEKALYRHGYNTTVLTGDVAQKARLKRLDKFKNGTYRVLVATDVAGRGLHVDDITHVINYNMPENPEDYVHRIGRTGRAGSKGISISFATEDDSFYIPAVEKFLGQKLEPELPPEELLADVPDFVRENPPRIEADKSKVYQKKRFDKKHDSKDKRKYSNKGKHKPKK